MPIWLRNFTFNKIKEHFEEVSGKKKEQESWLNKDVQNQAKSNKVNPPKFFDKMKGKSSYKK